MAFLVLVVHHPDEYFGVDQIGIYDTEEEANNLRDALNESFDWNQAAIAFELPTQLNKLHTLG